MCNFITIHYNRLNHSFLNTQYLPRVMFLYSRYKKYLDDDYAHTYNNLFEYVLDTVEKCSPLFWAIIDKKTDKFAGFVYLDNIIGSSENFHSAELTTCFEKEFWGDFTKKAAKEFINYCFDVYGFKKIKAQVYPENYRVKTLLKSAGFVKEAVLCAETMHEGRLQDIEIYSVFNQKLREVKNEN